MKTQSQKNTTKKYPLANRDEWYSNADYKTSGGRLVYMNPKQFLKSVKPLSMDEESIENIGILVDHIQSGKTLDPLVIYKDGKEDGRHRAYAAIELDITQVPVILFWE
jgi:hypothetical protein